MSEHESGDDPTRGAGGTSGDLTGRNVHPARPRPDQPPLVTAINSILHLALQSETAEELGSTCLRVAEELTGSRISVLAELDPVSRRLTAIATNAPGWERVADADGSEQELPFVGIEARGILGRVVKDGVGLYTNDPDDHPDRVGLPPGHPPLRSFLAVPLQREDRTIGILAVGNRPEGYGPEQLRTLEGLAAAVVEAVDRQRTEQELRDLNQALESLVAERTAEAERRAQALGRLAADLTVAEHRERERLARVLHDEVQQLLLGAKLSLAEIRRAGGSPAESIDGVSELIGECIAISRDLSRELSPPILQRGSLAEIMRWLASRLGDTHGLTVTTTAPDDLPRPLEHVRVLLFQVVRELLMNVAKHSGTMTARISIVRNHGELGITVEDDGTAFEPQAVEAGMERSSGGGFGLFSIRERLESLGGRLEIQRSESGGGCFRILIPEQALGLVFRPDQDRSTSGAIRLLAVDDHEVVRKGFVSLLEDEPDLLVVGEAESGAEALEQARTLAPDVVVLDVDMPGMGGVETTRRLKQENADLTVVGLSLHDDATIRRNMLTAGADAYVTKNAPAHELLAAIRDACARKGVGGTAAADAADDDQ